MQATGLLFRAHRRQIILSSRAGVSASYHFFFFFFFVGQGGGSAADYTISQRWEVVSRPKQLTDLWSGAPSTGTACSLELSLPSPAGIWFKTPLPVGGANTAHCPSTGKWSPVA